jgi:hypothetical protein
MPAKKSSSRKARTKTASRAPGGTGRVVNVWEDDPGEPTVEPALTPITVSVD